MKIVLDMQGAQGDGRFRGIGRYTMGFAKGVVRSRGDHEIILALNGLLQESIEPIRAAFDSLLPQRNIRLWHSPGPTAAMDPANEARRSIAEFVRESFLSQLNPDVIHVCSVFEGFGDDGVTSIGLLDKQTPITASLYDLIPMLNPEEYLDGRQSYAMFYEKNLKYLSRATQLLAISDFARAEGKAHLESGNLPITNVSSAADALFHKQPASEEEERALRQKFGIKDSFVLSTGSGEVRKNTARLIQAYAGLSPKVRSAYKLLIVGKIEGIELLHLTAHVKRLGLGVDTVQFAHYVSDQELAQLYNLCGLFVCPSLHEGFGLPVLEAMACGAPVICSDATSLPEVMGNEDALFDPVDVASMCAKMEQVLVDDRLASSLRRHALKQSKKFSWEETGRRAIEAWEMLSKHGGKSRPKKTVSEAALMRSLAPIPSLREPTLARRVAVCIAKNHPGDGTPQLLVDISELAQRDARTGIQRVVRSILSEWVAHPPPNCRIEPVYATKEQGYRYARRFMAKFAGAAGQGELEDEVVECAAGDVFIGLDLQGHVVASKRDFFQQLRKEGVTVKFVVYDLLCVLMPQYFPDGSADDFAAWLTVVCESDGAVCISKAVAEDLARWCGQNEGRRRRPLEIDWFHLGADLQNSSPSSGRPPDADAILQVLRQRPSFLLVGTLEPRKAHAQVMDAFELLWRSDCDVNLVIVGREGWKVEELIRRISGHDELGRRLLWLKGVSDAFLEEVYSASTCLIAASYGEGFGLPLIEAARHGIPIIARGIPVFREVAGSGAFYFDATSENDLAQEIRAWLALREEGRIPLPKAMAAQTWRNSAHRLLELCVGNDETMSHGTRVAKGRRKRTKAAVRASERSAVDVGEAQ